MELATVLLSVILASLVLSIVRWIIQRHKSHQTLKNYGIPGPEPEFFGGNLYHFKAEPTPHKIMDAWLKKYGDIFGYYIGEDIFIVIKDLELLKKIFIKDANILVNRPTQFLEADPFPATLVGLRDQHWKKVRNILTPTFSSGKMKLMTDIVSKKVDLTVDLIMKKAHNNEMFNIYSRAQGLTLDIIAACALAMKTQCQENEKDDLLLEVRNFFRMQYNKITEYIFLFPEIKKVLGLMSSVSGYLKSIDFIVNHLESVIKERRRNPEFKSADIIQALLDNSVEGNTGSTTKLTEKEVIANAFVVLLAGYETTATALAFTFHLLVKHPEVQERLYQEIKKAEDSSYATIQGLQYMDQVFSESLRLYPPVTGFVSRVCDQEYDLGPYKLPKGSIPIAPIWNIHYDPEIWPDPCKFDPDRFSPSNKGSIKSMSYLPFGAGPRNCIGSRFAQLEAKMILFKLLKKVKLVACEKTEDPLELICPALITFPKNGVWLKAIPRNENS